MKVEEQWERILTRDARYDGRVFYGVRTTGVYCRPSCPSRRPKRESVEFFANPKDAERAGYRACLRCKPTEISSQLKSVRLACEYIGEHLQASPTLAAISKNVGISPFYLHRLFKRTLGVTPREYQDAQREKRFRVQLSEGRKVTVAMYEAGYGSSSRLYEKSNRQLGMTPSEYRRNGEGAAIGYTIVDSPVGKILIAATAKGVCSIRFGPDRRTLEEDLKREFKAALIRRDEEGLSSLSQRVLNHLSGSELNLNLPLDVQATAFQRKVWGVLQAIPYGRTWTYSQVAKLVGNADATRAVARACASNPVALAIPCHRVIPKSGNMGGYRWGIKRKKMLLRMEKQARQGVKKEASLAVFVGHKKGLY